MAWKKVRTTSNLANIYRFIMSYTVWVDRVIVFPSDPVILSYPEEKLKWHQWVYLLVWGEMSSLLFDPFLSYADCFNSPPGSSAHWSKFLLVQIQYIKFKQFSILNQMFCGLQRRDECMILSEKD